MNKNIIKMLKEIDKRIEDLKQQEFSSSGLTLDLLEYQRKSLIIGLYTAKDIILKYEK